MPNCFYDLTETLGHFYINGSYIKKITIMNVNWACHLLEILFKLQVAVAVFASDQVSLFSTVIIVYVTILIKKT